MSTCSISNNNSMATTFSNKMRLVVWVGRKSVT